MTYSGCRNASAGVCCGDGGGGTRNEIDGRDVLGCWTGFNAHS